MDTTSIFLIIIILVVGVVSILWAFVEDRKKTQQQEAWNKTRAERERLEEIERQKRDEERKELIKGFVQTGKWTKDVAKAVYKGGVKIDMDEEMVTISRGEPDDKDRIEILKSGSRKERWVYGEKGHGADYISFKDGKVTRIQLKN